jgi:hypothetical protein
MTNRHFIQLFLLVCFGAFISGCSNSTSTTTPPATNPNVSPKKGSSYLFTMYQTDSTGNKTGSTMSDTATIIGDSLSLLGRTNVYSIVDGGDTSYYRYTGNFDLETYIQNSGLPDIISVVGDSVFHRWITIPVTSHSASIIILDSLDVSVTIPNVPLPIPAKVHVVSDYVGADSLKLVSETIAVQHCRITVTVKSNSAFISPPVTLTYNRDLYFAPKLGYYAKVTTFMDIPTALGLQGSKSGSVQTLVTYNVK